MSISASRWPARGISLPDTLYDCDEPPPSEGKWIVHELTFRTLLYRYFFFEWLFLDVTQGSLIERSAAWRHNQSQAHWLPTYMRRWLWCAVLLYGMGGIVEILIGAPAVSALFYVPSALSVSVNAVIVAAWLGLKTLYKPL
jgi:hypothetical protein